jgi:hypothetical protein
MIAIRLRDQIRAQVRDELDFGKRVARLFDPRPLVTRRRRPIEYNSPQPHDRPG